MQVSDRTRQYEAPLPETVFHSDPEIVNGTPVFVGSRVPIAALFDYLTAGDGLDEFLDDFPTVGGEQAVGAIEIARAQLIEMAYARAARSDAPAEGREGPRRRWASNPDGSSHVVGGRTQRRLVAAVCGGRV